MAFTKSINSESELVDESAAPHYLETERFTYPDLNF